ncbi:D-hexose-6-phosphate mutarotase [Planctomycetota bacterium]|nr:D-hexose-6-phosphate mutarotase [Planctomycetota bacterium]
MNNANQSIETLNEYFGKEGILRFEIGEGGLTRAIINHDLSEGEVYLHGAHITSFKPKEKEEILFVSKESNYEEGKAIRGGIPIVFPWFGPNAQNDTLPMHGYARITNWQLIRADYHKSKLVLEFKNTIENFELQFFVAFSEHLTMTLKVNNKANEILTYEEALHSYFKVSDIRNITIKGLEYDRYLDKMNDARPTEGSPDPINIDKEIDRVYLNTAGTVEIIDPKMDRRICIDKHHSKSTVVWNPWIEKAKRMEDFNDNEWQHMLCIEASNVASNHVHIKPDTYHEMTVVIRPEEIE